ncbi:MAG: VWA domain-containing protein [Candidatus Sericytochromatia bacterium]
MSATNSRTTRRLLLAFTTGLSLLAGCNGPQGITPMPKPTARPGAAATPAPIPEFAPQPLPTAMPGNAGGTRLSPSDAAAMPPMAAPAEASGPTGSGSVADGVSAPATSTRPGSPDMMMPRPEPFPEPQIQPEAGLLTAGEWDDIAHWSFWLGLLNKQDYSGFGPTWGLDTRQRFGVKLSGGNGPLADAPVQLLDADTQKVLFEARTNTRGEASLYANLLGTSQSTHFSIKAGLGEQTQTQPVSAGQGDAPTAISSQVKLEPAVNADLMLVVDTTGSMGDELEYLKKELQNVAQRISSQNSQDLTLRLSANFYKDLSDEYVIRPFPFTEDAATVTSQLNKQSASGGGDFPEALDVALADAVDEHKWSSTARARLLFLVCDAPAHQTEDVLKRLHTSLVRAAAKGIRIIPVASSGIDKETEFLLRMLAITTGGRYTFLTDDSGIGGGHIEPTIGDYKVEKLNDLMVRVATEYITGSAPKPIQTPIPVQDQQ